MFKPIQDRGKGKKKGSPTCFLLVTSTNVGISPYNFLAFSFATLCVPQASLKLLWRDLEGTLNFICVHARKFGSV